jgi:hypothetical protein
MGKIVVTARIDANNIFKGDVNISDANVRRIIDAYKKIYYPLGYNDGTPEAPVYRPATDQEVVLAIANGVVAGMKENARRLEKDEEAAAAANAVTDIPADPAVP